MASGGSGTDKGYWGKKRKGKNAKVKKSK